MLGVRGNAGLRPGHGLPRCRHSVQLLWAQARLGACGTVWLSTAALTLHAQEARAPRATRLQGWLLLQGEDTVAGLSPGTQTCGLPCVLACGCVTPPWGPASCGLLVCVTL